jgi:hypothetical protein
MLYSILSFFSVITYKKTVQYLCNLTIKVTDFLNCNKTVTN